MNNNKAFSLIELLVTIGILSVLGTVAVVTFLGYKKRTYKAGALSEMSYLLSLGKTVKNTDGGYHQYIYQWGYRPKGLIYAAIGTKASAGTNCCDKYPNVGTDPCSKSDPETVFRIKFQSQCPPGSLKSGGNFQGAICNSKHCTCKTSLKTTRYEYYSCKNTAPENAVNNIQICKAYPATENLACDLAKLDSVYNSASYNFSSGVKAQKLDSSGACVDGTDWCDCDSFYLASESSLFDEQLALNHAGVLCVGSEGTYEKEPL